MFLSYLSTILLLLVLDLLIDCFPTWTYSIHFQTAVRSGTPPIVTLNPIQDQQERTQLSTGVGSRALPEKVGYWIALLLVLEPFLPQIKIRCLFTNIHNIRPNISLSELGSLPDQAKQTKLDRASPRMKLKPIKIMIPQLSMMPAFKHPKSKI